jgi:hypothetical protein
MPPWLRISMVALLAGLCTGCRSGGLFWVDDKLSKLSAPSKTASPTLSKSTDEPVRKLNTTMAAAKTPTTSPRDVDDGALVAPPKMTSAAKSRAADLDPIPQRPLPTNEERIPAAFELATPRSVRGDRIPALDAATNRAVAADLKSTEDAEERTKTPVAPASYQRKQQDEANESESAEKSPPPIVRASHREETTPPERAFTRSTMLEPSEKSALQSAQAKPIPKATSIAPTNKLQLANITLCNEILEFGKVAGTKASLAPGGQALVYVEVSGRTSKMTGAGVETRLNGKLRLTPSAGGATMEWPFPNIVDVAPVERNEFFCFMILQLPDSLSEGDYRLEVVVEDVHGGAAASEETSLLVERSTTPTR